MMSLETSMVPTIYRDALNNLRSNYGDLVDNVPPLDKTDLAYFMSAYGFNVQRNESLTFGQFADMVEARYSQDDPRNRYAVKRLREFELPFSPATDDDQPLGPRAPRPAG